MIQVTKLWPPGVQMMHPDSRFIFTSATPKPHQSINFSKGLCTHSQTKLLCHCGKKEYRLDLLTQ